MLDYESMSSSTALSDSNGYLLFNNDYPIMYSKAVDEGQLYKEMSRRLLELELSLQMDKVKLEKISSMVEEFWFFKDEKHEISLRIDWLQRLYKVKKELPTTSTIKELLTLRKSILSVQKCPLRRQLLEEIEELQQKFDKTNK